MPLLSSIENETKLVEAITHACQAIEYAAGAVAYSTGYLSFLRYEHATQQASAPVKIDDENIAKLAGTVLGAIYAGLEETVMPKIDQNLGRRWEKDARTQGEI